MRAAALAVALMLSAFAAQSARPWPQALAQDKKDKDKDKDEDKEKKEKERKRKKQLSDIGSEFGTKSTSFLLKRVPADKKIYLSLDDPESRGDYAVDHARGQLNNFFNALQTLSVDLTKMNALENVASFPMTLRKKGEDKTRNRTLYVTIGAAPDYPLLKLVVDK